MRLFQRTVLVALPLFLFLNISFSQGAKKAVTQKPAMKRDIAVIETSMGNIEIELFSDLTPTTVKNFIGLAKKGTYNGLIFHRVIDGFMIQGGDPKGTGTGGESIYGKPFEDEFVDTLRHSRQGTVSMANRGRNTNTSQFFITLAATPWLDGRHTIFGRVKAGMDILAAIGKVKTQKPGDRPIVDVVMKKVIIKQANGSPVPVNGKEKKG